MIESLQYINLPVIFSSPEHEESLEMSTEEGLPELPGLIFEPIEEHDVKFAPPSIFGKWQGLKEAIKTQKETKIGDINRVILPNIPSKISPIPEAKRVIAVSPEHLRQEKVLEILNKIEVDKLEDSIIFPKGGYSLPELKGFAKQLGISTADLRKAGVAQRILEKIKLKGKTEE